MNLKQALSAFDGLDSNHSFYAAICDLNGNLRGKRYAIADADKLLKEGFRMPLSTLGVDIWGEDIIAGEFVFEKGDADGVCQWTGRPPLIQIGEQGAAYILPFWLFEDEGDAAKLKGFAGDPRHALLNILNEYRKLGYRPVTAMEMEFYLYDPAKMSPQPPKLTATGQRIDTNSILCLRELENFETFLQDLYTLCERQEISLDAAIAENGPGQFEVNLNHGDDALKIADDALFFKEAAKTVAKDHGLAATFMAKPYGDRSGNGMHVHFSLLDEMGVNIFDDGTEEGSELMKSAVAGMLDAMVEMTLIFAPHYNSYRRLRPQSHAPNTIAWGYENRTTAIRIPGGEMTQRRIEHRVAGADANPYLVLASILGAGLLGIKAKSTPPPAISGNGYEQDLKSLPATWHQAIEEFSKGSMIPQIFNPTLQRMFSDCKAQEFDVMMQAISEFEYQSYL